MEKDDNRGKCGHVKCAGGKLCYEQGAPMSAYKPYTLADEIEELGNNSKYDEQARVFLERTGAKIEARYIGLAPHFGDNEPRDRYEVRIVRGTREYLTEYGDSIANTEQRIAKMLGREYDYMAPRVRKGTGGHHGYFYESTVRKWAEQAKEWGPAGTDYRPSAYSVLACMTTYEPADNVDDFAHEFGIEKPSEAIRVYEAVKKEYAGMLAMFNDAELDALRTIA